MRRTILALALTALAALPTAASAQTDVMATVNRFVDAFNKGDTTTIRAVCADPASIIDEFPPHEWHGAGACSRWMSDYNTDAEKNGITDGIVTLGTPLHVDISTDRAYVVAPANYTYKKRGAQVQEIGSMFTLVLQKGATGWLITGWAWAKH
ncbi:MAG TPA: nuclear transport factor 2 family protein [Gemmatimonadales bacterium]|jgi:ketosteroid isomerase-like protein|nr:nuclear transport factor 2 family protein [Gemmatimonadales bacterium]